MTLSNALKSAQTFGLTEDMIVFKVASEYLKDVFGYELTVETASTLSLPTICSFDGKAGAWIADKFYPLTETFKDVLSLEKQETKEKDIYFTLDYSTLVEGAEPSYRVPSLLRDLDKRSMNALFNAAKDAETAAKLLYPGSPTKATADGEYGVTEVISMRNDAYRLVNDTFSLYLSKANVEALGGATKLATAKIVVKDGAATIDGISVGSGGGGDISNIPAKKGFEVTLTEFKTYPGKECVSAKGSDGTMYWLPAEARKSLLSIAPIQPSAIKLKVNDIRTKDEKEYPVTASTLVK